MDELLNQESMLHLRFNGRSLDLPLRDLGIGRRADDRAIKIAVSRHLDVNEEDLRDYTVNRHQTGNLTVRPEAIFG